MLVTFIIQRNFNLTNVLNFLYGGRAYGGVYWFIPCLFITIIVFAALELKLRKLYIIIILVFYLIGHIESVYFLPHNVNYLSWKLMYKIPLNLDVCFMTIPYFALGYYLKEHIDSAVENLKVFSLITLLCLFIIWLNISGVLNFQIDMKIANYKHIIFDAVVPTLFFIWILQISRITSMLNVIMNPIKFISQNTLSIMYLQFSILDFVSVHFTKNITLLVLLVVLISLVFSFVCTKNITLNFLFLGNEKYLKKQIIKSNVISS